MRYLLHLPPRSHGVLLPLICHDLSVEHQLHLRLIKFVKALTRSSNPVLRQCMRLVTEGSGSAVSNSVSVVCEAIRCRREALAESDLRRIRATFADLISADDETVATASLLHDLLGLRHESLIIRNHLFQFMTLILLSCI